METKRRRYRRSIVRLRLAVYGTVQGVGFRPFTYSLAVSLGLTGWVRNTPRGVLMELEGRRASIDTFRRRLEREQPAACQIVRTTATDLDPVGWAAFEIKESRGRGSKLAPIVPDLATCKACLDEIFDPHNRRYRYPFTNCTHCGPRFSILQDLPYDRGNTSMKAFRMCARCQAEFDDPANRRFHAQPNACPECGPHLELWNRDGDVIATNYDAIQYAADVVRNGMILAVKGIGGFHLFADARNDNAVQLLRQRKRRPEKPFAVMFPKLAAARAYGEISTAAARLLQSPQAPIVLLRRLRAVSPQDAVDAQHPLSQWVAPGNPYIGAVLPYSPLHHLLMAESGTYWAASAKNNPSADGRRREPQVGMRRAALGFPVIATSGNAADEVICVDEVDALQRLGNIADRFLVHNRPIIHHADDSIVQVVLGRPQILRRARGYAPAPIHVRSPLTPAVAVGAHLKSTVAISVGNTVIMSQHLGDLDTVATYQAFSRTTNELCRLYDFRPSVMIADKHPDYASTRYARQGGLPVVTVQHHVAHVCACMAEHDVRFPVLGVAWDGTGFGDDGTIWGGEFLTVTNSSYARFAAIRPFPLPGGDQAAKEPRRAAVGLLYEYLGEAIFDRTDLPVIPSLSAAERRLFRSMLGKKINTHYTSSVGRLFDAVAAIVGLRQYVEFEGQAAMDLEFASLDHRTTKSYRVLLTPAPDGDSGPRWHLDFAPMVNDLLADVENAALVPEIAAKFHNGLINGLVEVARRSGYERIVLTGGCFQNRRLLEGAVRRLRKLGLQPYWHQRIPTNDGGIAFGQIIAAAREKK